MADNSTVAGGRKGRTYEGPRFRIRTPAENFTRVHTFGLRFVDSLAWTDDEAKAAHCRDVCGYEVFDRETESLANPLNRPVEPEFVTSKDLKRQADAERGKALASQVDKK